MYGERAWRQLRKNAGICIEQVLEETPHKTAAVRPPTITKTVKVRHAEHCWRSRDELINDIRSWTPSHGPAKAVRPTRTYIQQLCADSVTWWWWSSFLAAEKELQVLWNLLKNVWCGEKSMFQRNICIQYAKHWFVTKKLFRKNNSSSGDTLTLR